MTTLPPVAAPPSSPLLQVEDLSITVPGRLARSGGGPHGRLPVVREVSFAIERGEMVALVGESGAGKSLTSYALLRLLPPGVEISGGRILLEGRDLVPLPEAEMRRVRGGRIAMVFQEPMTALNPAFTVGFQIVEALRAHPPEGGASGAANRAPARALTRSGLRAEARRLLDRVAIPDAARRLSSYPHELSGGQRLGVVIAMALACGPALLVADEPTSALDVTVQARILDLLRSLREELDLAILLVTHDLAVVAETCRRVLVMTHGEIVEEAPAERLFAAPVHPYTRTLLAAAAGVPAEGAA